LTAAESDAVDRELSRLRASLGRRLVENQRSVLALSALSRRIEAGLLEARQQGRLPPPPPPARGVQLSMRKSTTVPGVATATEP